MSWQLFVVFVGVASANILQSWKIDTQYDYVVLGTTTVNLDDYSNQTNGVVLRAFLTIRPKSEDTLQAKIRDVNFAESGSGTWNDLPMSDKVFVIKMNNSFVSDLRVNNDVPTWEINVIKSIVSLLQISTSDAEWPSTCGGYTGYRIMEDSVGGKCAVDYRVLMNCNSTIVPALRGAGNPYAIVKKKNYCDCEQRSSYYFGSTETNNWEHCSKSGDKFLSRDSLRMMLVIGDKTNVTIQSSFVVDNIKVNLNLNANQKGGIESRMTLTLLTMRSVSGEDWTTPDNLHSVGNLVYSHNSPFTGPREDRRTDGPTDSNINRQDNAYDFSASPSSGSGNYCDNNKDAMYWQSTPNLNEPPHTPLSTFFVECKGKSAAGASRIGLEDMSFQVAFEIGQAFEVPEFIPKEQTLEKFTILAEIVRAMSTEQIANVQERISRLSYAHQSFGRNIWRGFRDAVAQAGTGPALVTIMNWIVEEKIVGIDAASVVRVLSTTARTPTPEYMNFFFKMITTPKIANEEFLNSTAIITFAELVRYSQKYHFSAQNGHSQYNDDCTSVNENPAIIRDYIPYMSEQLQKSIENSEYARSHVFIRALGNIAHPTILAVFKPYLEGKIPASNFQRVLMILSINKLASLRPRLPRSILYKIYQNTLESDEIRCAAIAVLLSTNPPRHMLRRLANYGDSQCLMNVVNSSNDSENKRYKSIFQNGWHNYFGDGSLNNLLNITNRIHTYQGHDVFFKLVLFSILDEKYGNLNLRETEFGVMSTIRRQLIDAWNEYFKSPDTKFRMKNKHIEFSPESIRKLLKIESYGEKLEPEAALWMKSVFSTQFMSFDKHILERIPEYLAKTAASLKEGWYYDVTNTESYDSTLSFTMESGLPFFYTKKEPTMSKLFGSLKGEHVPDSVKGSINLTLVYSTQIQTRFGFVSPVEYQQYMVGVNKNFQTYLPILAEVNYEKSDKRLTLKLGPLEPHLPYTIFHNSVVPFLSRHNIVSMMPVQISEKTQTLTNNERLKQEFQTSHMVFAMEFDSDSDSVLSPTDDFSRQLDALTTQDINYSKYDIRLSDNVNEKPVIVTASYETIYDTTTRYDKSRSKSSSKAHAPRIYSKKINDPERRNLLLMEAIKGIAAVDGFAWDFGIEVTGPEGFQYVVTSASGMSTVDDTFRILTYTAIDCTKHKKHIEACVGLEYGQPRSFTFINDTISSDFDIDYRIGETCENGYNIQIHGEQEQTDEYRKTLYEQLTSSASKTSLSNLNTMDKTRLTIKFDPKLRSIQERLSNYLYFTSSLLYPNVQAMYTPYQQVDEDTVTLSMDLFLPENTATFTYQSPNIRLSVDKVTVNPIIDPVAKPYLPHYLYYAAPHDHFSKNKFRSISNLTYVSSFDNVCLLDSYVATTFDGASYPIDLGKCWHVAMTTFPVTIRGTETKENIDEDMNVSVVVRDSTDGDVTTKDVYIVLDRNELMLTVQGSKILVVLDGKTIDLTDEQRYNHIDGNKRVFEMFQLPNGPITLFSLKFEVGIFYTGQAVQIMTSKKYINKIQGLCNCFGNCNGNQNNDESSRMCIKMGETFGDAYALTENDCERAAMKKSTKRPFECPNNERGRGEDGTWEYYAKNNDYET